MRGFYLLLFCLVSVPALAQQSQLDGAQPRDRVFTVLNRANQPIGTLLVSSSREDEWGSNRLIGPPLVHGRRLKVRLSLVQDCRYDLQVTYVDGKIEEKHDQDICHNHQIVFDGSQAVLLTNHTEQKVLLLNRAQRAVGQVFISPKEAMSWGNDLLGPGPLQSGAETQLSYRGGCVVDLRIVFDNNSAEERREVNLCGHPAVMIGPGWTTTNDIPVTEGDFLQGLIQGKAAFAQPLSIPVPFPLGAQPPRPASTQAMLETDTDLCVARERAPQ